MSSNNWPKKLLYILLGFQLIILSLYIVSDMSIFDLDGEANLGDWFSSLQLALSGITLFLIFNFEKNKKTKLKESPYFWLLLSFGFIFASFDEASMLHERLGRQFGNYLLDNSSLSFVNIFSVGPTFAWLLLYIPLVIILLSVVFFFLLNQLKKENLLLPGLVGFGIFFMGFFLFEIIQLLIVHDVIVFSYKFEVLIEEALEFFGESLMLYTFLSILIKKFRIIRL